MEDEVDREELKALNEFRSTLVTFKRPVIDAMTTNTEDMQDTATLTSKVYQRLDELYDVLEGCLYAAVGRQRGGSAPSDIQEKLCGLLMQTGGLKYLQAHPNSLDAYLNILHVYFKQYPLTISQSLVATHQRNKTLSLQRAIIPNEEGEGE